MSITIKKGSILDADCDVIVHQVNCRGCMGKGLAKSIRAKYPEVYTAYMDVACRLGSLALGHVLTVEVAPGKYVANMFGQDSFGYVGRHTDYEAVEQALTTMNKCYRGLTVGFPMYIGCGLGGGDWNIIYSLIEKCTPDLEVYLYKV